MVERVPPLLAKEIIITSTFHPIHFCKRKDDEEHLLRLIDEIKEFTQEPNFVLPKRLLSKETRDRLVEFLQ